MTKQITLPREVVEKALRALECAADLLDEQSLAALARNELRAALNKQVQPLEFNGLTKEETDVTMSVRGLSEQVQPAQCSYPDCKCPIETPCLKGLVPPAQGERGKLANKLLFEAEAMHKAVAGEYTEGTFHALNWADKPHRVVYDACKLMKEAAALLQSNADRVPLTNEQIVTLPLSAVTVKDAVNDVKIVEAAHKITKGQR